MIQRRAARYVTGRHSNTSSVSDMMHHLQWRTLADRRTDFRLAMFYKIVNDKEAIPKTDRLIPLSDSHATCIHFLSKFHHAVLK